MPVYPRVLEHFVPGARHVLDRYATDENVNEEDDGGGARVCS